MNRYMRSLASVLAALVSFTLIFSAIPAVALAAAGDTGVTGIWNWTELSDGTLEIGMPTAPFSGSYVLPSQLDISQTATPDIRNVTQIGYGAFMGSPGLTAMTLPPTLKVIEPYAFDGCTAFTAITIPDNVTNIGDSAFDGCTNLQTVTLPGNGSSQLASIGQNAFSECSSLESIAIPDTVTNIGPVAFTNCTSLSSATLPSNPAFTAIPTGLFNGCSALHTVTIPSSVTAIGIQSFIGSGISSITIPPTITTIGDQAFVGTELTAITVPSGVTSIGSMAFGACSNLTAITVNSANANYCSDSGVLYNISKTSLLACPGATAGVFQMPAGVSDIAEGAFIGCQSLTGVTMTDDMQTIGMFAFGMSGITSIQIPANVTTIGPAAFMQCAGLKKAVFLCPGVTLGVGAFTASGIAGDGIYGFDGSTAQTYAANNHPALPFHILYTVTFQSFGGSSVDETYVETGHTFAAPTAPTKSGVTFSGWYADSGLTDAWDFSTDTVTDDMTLYAAWAAPTPTPTPSATPTATPSPTATPAPTATLSPSPSVAPTSTATPSPTLQIIPSDDNIFTGGRITITPSVEGGTWSYDSSFLSRDGNTFTGLKPGTVRVTYTAGSQSTYFDIVITQAEMPQTGQDFSPVLWALVLAALAGGAALLLAGRRRKLQSR